MTSTSSEEELREKLNTFLHVARNTKTHMTPLTDDLYKFVQRIALEARIDELLRSNVGIDYTPEEVELAVERGLLRELDITRYKELQSQLKDLNRGSEEDE